MKSGSYNSESDSAVEQNTINVLKLIGASLSKPHTSMTVLRTHVYILPYRFFTWGATFCYFRGSPECHEVFHKLPIYTGLN